MTLKCRKDSCNIMAAQKPALMDRDGTNRVGWGGSSSLVLEIALVSLLLSTCQVSGYHVILIANDQRSFRATGS